METFPLKSKVMTFKGKVPVTSKIVTGKTILGELRVYICSYVWDVKFRTKRKKTPS